LHAIWGGNFYLLTIHTIVRWNSVHHGAVISKKGKLVGSAYQKSPWIHGCEEQNTVIGNKGFVADNAEFNACLIINERLFADVRELYDCMSANFGTLLNNAALNDGRWMNFGIWMNVRNRT